MTYIRAENLSIEFPIYSGGSRSLKNAVLRATTGGVLQRDAADRVFVRALLNLNFEMKEGDRIGLVGHNGSGKTTLLRVLAGGYEPARGSLTLRGSIASMLSIALGMESEATGYENILVRGTLMGLSVRQIRELTPAIEEFSELGGYLDMPLRTYSSGMYMRLAFAISTCLKADIILMDEWLSIGDEAFSKKAQGRLQAMLDNAKILVLASHDKNLVRSNCNKIFHLEHGELVQIEKI